MTAYPLFWLFIDSLKSQQRLPEQPVVRVPRGLALVDNYVDRVGDRQPRHDDHATRIIVTIPSLVLIVLLGTAAGFALEVLVFKGRATVLLLFLAGIMIPGQMILLPLFTIYFQLGITGSYWPLILTYTASGLPLTVFMMATYFRAIPREIFEAATLDGASHDPDVLRRSASR